MFPRALYFVFSAESVAVQRSKMNGIVKCLCVGLQATGVLCGLRKVGKKNLTKMDSRESWKLSGRMSQGGVSKTQSQALRFR
jgi:hypothetical protein